jgi:hypothetical protein
MDVPTHGHQSASRSSPGTSETLERWQMNGLRYLVPAGAYGKSRREVTLDRCGARGKRVRRLPQSQWCVFCTFDRTARALAGAEAELVAAEERWRELELLRSKVEGG